MKNVFVILLLIASAIAQAATTEGGSQQVTIRPAGTSAGATGELRLKELTANGTNHVGLKAPDSVSADKVWTLPAADGINGQVLTTNGSGVLSFTTATGSVTNVTASSPLASSGGATPNLSIGSIIGSSLGGTGNGFTKFTGPTTSEKTFTLPNTNGVILAPSSIGTNAQIPVSDGTTITMRSIGTDATITNTGALTIANNAITTAKISDSNVTYAKIANGAALSVLGRASNSSGVNADITASTAGTSLEYNGTSLAFRVGRGVNSQSSAYTVVASDNGKIIACNASTAFTVTLTSAATLGNGFTVTILKTNADTNSATGALSIDPAGTETINGVSANQRLHAQYSHLTIMSDGTNWLVLSANDWMKAEQATASTASASGAFATRGPIAVPPGEWDLSAHFWMDYTPTTTQLSYSCGISADGGAGSYSDQSLYENAVAGPGPDVTKSAGLHNSVSNYRVVLTAQSTDYYMKIGLSYTGTAPTYRCQLKARRMR